MTKEELQTKLDNILSSNFDAKVGNKYITIKHYWTRSPIDSRRGKFNKSFKVKIENLLPFIEMGQYRVEGYLGWFINDTIDYASDEYYIKQGICPTCGTDLCEECNMCPYDYEGHSEDCPYFNSSKGKENK